MIKIRFVVNTVVVNLSKLNALSHPSWFVTESMFSVWDVDGSGSEKECFRGI